MALPALTVISTHVGVQVSDEEHHLRLQTELTKLVEEMALREQHSAVEKILERNGACATWKIELAVLPATQQCVAQKHCLSRSPAPSRFLLSRTWPGLYMSKVSLNLVNFSKND